MQELNWLETFGDSVDDAVAIVNKFCWKLRISEHNGNWYVTSGDIEEHVIFTSDSKEAVDAFLYGMALAYSGIPQEFFDPLVEDIKKWHEEL